ncbi:MAG: HupE/UreJ family protein [Burkholderiaceae bacterium]
MAVARLPVDPTQDARRVTMSCAPCAAAPGGVRIRATIADGKEIVASELALIDANAPAATFFEGRIERLSRFVGQGVAHILGGADHLLFLITLLAAASGLGRWAWLLFAFTIAHAGTYALASTGVVGVSGRWVEPMIAASIVLVALGHVAGLRLRLRDEIIAVFAIGLVHGLGFASSMDAQGTAGAGTAIAIIGFNLGIELGQLGVAAALYVVLEALRRLGGIGLAAACERGPPTWSV